MRHYLLITTTTTYYYYYYYYYLLPITLPTSEASGGIAIEDRGISLQQLQQVGLEAQNLFASDYTSMTLYLGYSS